MSVKLGNKYMCGVHNRDFVWRDHAQNLSPVYSLRGMPHYRHRYLFLSIGGYV